MALLVFFVGRLEAGEDPFFWLEDGTSPKTREWVEKQNQETVFFLEQKPVYAELKASIQSILSDRQDPPLMMALGDHLFDFLQNGEHPRGVWRRTTQAGYRAPQPSWEILLDLDELSKKENQGWTWQNTVLCLPAGGERCLVFLSKEGASKSVVREFDLKEKRFLLAGEKGFFLPEAISDLSWIDKDRLLVATDFGPESFTSSGMPRILRVWKRGDPLEKAVTVMEVMDDSVLITSAAYFRPEKTYWVISQWRTYFEREHWLYDPDTRRTAKIRIPKDADLKGMFDGSAVAVLRSDWKAMGREFKAGSLVAVPSLGEPDLIMAPEERMGIDTVAFMGRSLLVGVLRNVQSEMYEAARSAGGWRTTFIPLPPHGYAKPVAEDPKEGAVYVQYENFLTPPRIYKKTGGAAVEKMKQQPGYFDASRMLIEQFETRSTGGERIPYFVVRSKAMRMDGGNPALMYAYGSFSEANHPYYSGPVGKAWLERGGVYVIPAIRGGGEFGPEWHAAATKEKRQNSFDDFIAVAEDLISRGIASPGSLGIMGGSGGGLLVGAAFTQRPDLFGAVVCRSPLLDMLRYHKLSGGKKWEAEYGNPDDPKMRAVISAYSPYEHLAEKLVYPPVFFMTAANDDLVDPAHARKMAAKMESQGHPFSYFESSVGGHSLDAGLEQDIRTRALYYTYLWTHLAPRDKKP